MTEARRAIDVALVRRLVDAQFPQWSSLAIAPVAIDGWDNASFRLGRDKVVRLPRAAEYAGQVSREDRWLPLLAPHLPLEIPHPVATGNPTDQYPWHWSVRRWIDGETAAATAGLDEEALARDLAGFLTSLQAIDIEGPAPGPANFDRGGKIDVYDAEVRAAVAHLVETHSGDMIDGDRAMRVWNEAKATSWAGQGVWLHGDVSAGNLLLRDGRLAAVIDFGQMAVGDPACDLAIAWTFFGDRARASFKSALRTDAGAWSRGRAWALWKALIVVARLAETNAVESRNARRTLDTVLRDAG